MYHTHLLITVLSLASALLYGAVLMTIVVVVLLAIGGIVVALYLTNRRVQKAIDRRMYSPQRLREDAAGYRLIEVIPPVAFRPKPEPTAPVWEVIQPTHLGGMGLVFLAQQVQVVVDPGLVAIGVIALLGLFLLLLMGGAFDDKPQHPLQRSFDGYLDELQRESNAYLDKVDRLYRNH